MILLVHQSSDLYGSDRSFLAVLEMLVQEYGCSNVMVMLPTVGPLSDYVINMKVGIIYSENGVLRKYKLRSPFKLFFNMMASINYHINLFKKFDLIYINTVVCVAAIFAARLSPSKSMIHIREAPGVFDRYFFRILLKFSKSHLIFNSQFTKNIFNLPGAVVYNGTEFNGRLVDNGQKNNFDKFLFVGRVAESKGHIFLINAIKKLKNPIHLIIAGDCVPGNERIFDSMLLNLKNSIHRVEFLGFIEDTSKLYSWADYVLVPSVKPESFGRVVVEAMSYGKPVIASSHGGCLEIYSICKFGYLFESENVDDFVSVIEVAINSDFDTYNSLSMACVNGYFNEFTSDAYKRSMSNQFSSILRCQ